MGNVPHLFIFTSAVELSAYYASQSPFAYKLCELCAGHTSSRPISGSSVLIDQLFCHVLNTAL